MITYIGTFLKKVGDERKMHFARIEDLPEDFLLSHTKGTSQKRNLAEGQELVWDLENQGFRIFNWKTAIGDPIKQNN